MFDKTSKTDNELKYWRCEQKNRCKARLHTTAGEVLRELNSHSHETCAAQVEVAVVKTKIKRRAEETLKSPTVAVNECLSDIPQSSLTAIPNMAALRKIIHRNRNSVMNAPSNPADLQYNNCLCQNATEYMSLNQECKKIFYCVILDQVLTGY